MRPGQRKTKPMMTTYECSYYTMKVAVFAIVNKLSVEAACQSLIHKRLLRLKDCLSSARLKSRSRTVYCEWLLFNAVIHTRWICGMKCAKCATEEAMVMATNSGTFQTDTSRINRLALCPSGRSFSFVIGFDS